MTNTNGNQAIADAEQDALAQQNELPPPYVPPPPPEPSAAEKPKELALFSAEWFEASIAVHEMLLQQRYAAMCATREYAEWQAQHGVVENTKAQRALLLQQAATSQE